MQKEIENYGVQGGTDPRLVKILEGALSAIEALNERVGKLEAAENLHVNSAYQADLQAFVINTERTLTALYARLTLLEQVSSGTASNGASEAPTNSPEPTPSGEGDAVPQGEVA